MHSKPIDLFNQLLQPYPRAAAGLLDDLCNEVAYKIQETPDDQAAIDSLITTIRDCFRPMDAGWPPDCHAWDLAFMTFGRWLWRPLPKLHEAVREITGWPEDKLQQCKRDYRESVRILCDDYARLWNCFDGSNDSSNAAQF